jgi:hypothetical protein
LTDRLGTPTHGCIGNPPYRVVAGAIERMGLNLIDGPLAVTPRRFATIRADARVALLFAGVTNRERVAVENGCELDA